MLIVEHENGFSVTGRLGFSEDGCILIDNDELTAAVRRNQARCERETAGGDQRSLYFVEVAVKFLES